MARNFKHKRTRKPAGDNLVFAVLRACRGETTANLARASGLAHSTISKLRTRRTRYPRLQTASALLEAVGARFIILEPETVQRVERVMGKRAAFGDLLGVALAEAEAREDARAPTRH